MVAELVPKPASPPSLGELAKRAADLGDVEGLKAFTDEAVRAAGLAQFNTPQRILYSIADLGALPPPSWLIPGEVLDHALNMLVGPSGGGKSFLAVDYALRIAQQHGRNVIYIAPEGASGYFDRATAWCKHHRYSGDRLLFDIRPLDLHDSVAVQAFIDAIKPLNPALVVIDTLARCMVGKDENTSRDMGVSVEACATVTRETGAAVLLVHHTGKSGISERGSGALYAACDSVISLTNEDGLITLSCAKSKDSKPFADRHLRLVEVATTDGRSSCVALPSERVITQGAPLSPTQKKILETLALETFVTVGAKAQSLQGQLGISERSIFRTLSALMREGYVRQAAKGDPYFIEEKGLAALQLPPTVNDNSSQLPTSDMTDNDSSTTTQLTAATATTPLGVAVAVSSGSSTNGGQPQHGPEVETPLPYLDALTKPLHGSNGGHS